MNTSSINFSLSSVRELEGATAINKRALRRLDKTQMNVDMNVRVIPNLERSTVSLVVTCSYVAIMGMIRTRILNCTVITTFEIEDLAAHISLQGEEVVFGGKLMMSMLGIAVGALRGIVSVRTADTPLVKHPLPIIDLSALMYRLRYGKSAPSAIPL